MNWIILIKGQNERGNPEATVDLYRLSSKDKMKKDKMKVVMLMYDHSILSY